MALKRNIKRTQSAAAEVERLTKLLALKDRHIEVLKLRLEDTLELRCLDTQARRDLETWEPRG